jgi:hypothetical protein
LNYFQINVIEISLATAMPAFGQIYQAVVVKEVIICGGF